MLCRECGTDFVSCCKNRSICSDACRKARAAKSVEKVRTDNLKAYARKSAKYRAKNLEQVRVYQKMLRYQSWDRYLQSLASRGKERKRLSKKLLLSILKKQKHKCAISGIEMTHCHGSPFNASIDRINAGGEYIEDNIQLVCKCINVWRKDLDVSFFIEVCKQVAEHNS